MGEARETIVSMKGICKSFYGVYANRDVDFSLEAGEVHSLLGENGAGKTTLMNVLAGLYAPEAGTISVNGRDVEFASPQDAIENAIGMVHQHFMLVPAMTVWENMILGMNMPMLLPKRRVMTRISELSERYGLAVNPSSYVWQLSIGEQQRVEILKMLYRGSRILIMDEPTSVLTPLETAELFATLRRMTAEGHGVVFISHKMEEVMEISNRLTVLRRGERVGTMAASDVAAHELAELMVGREVTTDPLPRKCVVPHVTVRCGGVCTEAAEHRTGLSDVNMEAASGSILGIAGVAGNGQEELCCALTGLTKISAGSISMDDMDMSGLGAEDFLRQRVSYIPADRRGTGLVPNMNICENVALKLYWQASYLKFRFFMNWHKLARLTADLVARFDVSLASLASPARVLSGGNMQKLMLARELSGAPRVVIAMQPTWGLDVGATRFVHERLMAARNSMAAVILISEDLDELMALSDRIGVLYRGRFRMASGSNGGFSREEIGLMMAGINSREAA